MTASFSNFKRHLIAISVACCLTLISFSQNIVVAPYLQNGSPTSMTVMWETDVANDGYVDWGVTAATLTNTVTSASISGEGNNRIHTALITGLNDDTKYFYKVRTFTGAESVTYFFKTHPTKTSEKSLNIVAMSDMQRDGSNPNVFETIINSGIIPVANANYPNGMEDIEAILIPGDLVATGTYSSWRDTYLTPSVGITPYVPTYPVPGNHEYYGTGISLFLDYSDLPLNGSPSNPEEWWYKDISNLRIVGLNSNSPNADLASQLLWLENMLSDAGADTTIDFVFAELHHPYKSELWLPGELDFTGDIIAILESFSTTYNKPSIHFFGHTHAYSRGQSRDHNHLWVNAATAGGAIDNWGEFPNADYDEFVLSEDEYGFVMVEVEAGADPKFVLKRYSQGDENIYEDNTLSDEITIKRFSTAPDMPIGITPVGENDLSCIEFNASAFSNGTNTHQASHWQIVEGCDFSVTSVQNVWKQSMNWYNEVDTQVNDDLTDEDEVFLMANTLYCWRVRYRNSNLTWSDWSDPLSFNTTPANYITGNLLQNGDAESGTLSWIGDIESLIDNECGSVPVYQGNYFFAVGGVCANEQTAGLASQIIDISAYATEIDDGNCQVEYLGYMRTWASNNDLPEMHLEFLDDNNSLLGTSTVISNTTPEWLLKSAYELVPFSTRILRVVLEGTRLAGNDNDSYFDSLSVRLRDYDCLTNGIVEMDPSEIIKIYPNPTSSELLYETLIGFERISITDQLGREVLTANIFGNSGALDLGEITEGIYTITFIKENAKMSRRFIKSNF